MGQHDGAGVRPDGGLDGFRRRVVAGQRGIDEDRNQPVLEDGIDGGRKPGRRRDDLVAGLERPRTQQRRGQCRKRQQVGGRPRVGGQRPLHANARRDQALELVVEASGSKPAIKRGIDQGDVGIGIEDASGGRDGVAAGDEGRALFLMSRVVAHLVKDQFSSFAGGHGLEV
jgi:hypothetical protein